MQTANNNNDAGVALKTLSKAALGFVLDLVFPKRCVQCNASGEFMCPDCLAKVTPVAGETCERCALPLRPFETCSVCSERGFEFDSTKAVFVMEGVVAKAVHNLKYNDIRALAPVMGGMMANLLKEDGYSADMVVPVPLHPARMRERGYNQSELLAKVIATECDLELNSGVLKRTVKTAPQVSFRNLKERAGAMAGAFELNKLVYIKGRSILLIDDVVTTGSTVNSCTKALKSAGAARVEVCAFARTINFSEWLLNV